MPVTTVTIEGLSELDAALQELGKSLARGVLQRILLARGAPIAETARQMAPVEEGHLQRSIRVSKRKPAGADAGRAAYAEVMQGGGSKGEAVAALRAARRASPGEFAEAFVGPDRRPGAIMQEFGTFAQPPQPFLRPAWDAHKGRLVDGIGDDLWAEIEATAARKAARAARRAARAAGKAGGR